MKQVWLWRDWDIRIESHTILGSSRSCLLLKYSVVSFQDFCHYCIVIIAFFVAVHDWFNYINGKKVIAMFEA